MQFRKPRLSVEHQILTVIFPFVPKREQMSGIGQQLDRAENHIASPERSNGIVKYVLRG